MSETQPDNQPWPPYFETQAAVPEASGNKTRMPTALIDAFYLQGGYDPTTFVGVVGCDDGTLQAIVGDEVSDIFGTVGDQVEALKVAQRNTFRGIAATRVGLLSLEAISQDIATRGFNDPVAIYGGLTTATAGGAEHGNEARKGTMTVGRLDLLVAWRQGLEYRFRSMNPNNANSFMVPFLLDPSAQAGGGRASDLVIAYPAFGPMTFEYGDNGAVARNIVYDLLLSVQKDLREEGIDHPLASTRIPVPNRQRLEAELGLDGYEIRGDEAVKAQQSSGSSRGLMAHLRAFTKDWAADHIELPREATDEDYAQIIDSLLPHIQGHQDRQAARALSQLVTAQVFNRPSASTYITPTVVPYITPQPHTPRPHAQPTAARPVPATPAPRPEDSWSHDFAATPALSQSAATDRQAARRQWEADFDLTGRMRVTSSSAHPGTATSSAEKTGWSGDFSDVAQARRITRPIPSAALPAQTPVTHRDWASDFGDQTTGKVTSASTPGNAEAGPLGNPSDTRQPKGDDWASDFGKTGPSEPKQIGGQDPDREDWSGDFS